MSGVISLRCEGLQRKFTLQNQEKNISELSLLLLLLLIWSLLFSLEMLNMHVYLQDKTSLFVLRESRFFLLYVSFSSSRFPMVQKHHLNQICLKALTLRNSTLPKSFQTLMPEVPSHQSL